MVLIEQSFMASFRCQQDGVISRGARITGRGFDGLTFENHMEDMLNIMLVKLLRWLSSKAWFEHIENLFDSLIWKLSFQHSLMLLILILSWQVSTPLRIILFFWKILRWFVLNTTPLKLAITLCHQFKIVKGTYSTIFYRALYFITRPSQH